MLIIGGIIKIDLRSIPINGGFWSNHPFMNGIFPWKSTTAPSPGESRHNLHKVTQRGKTKRKLRCTFSNFSILCRISYPVYFFRKTQNIVDQLNQQNISERSRSLSQANYHITFWKQLRYDMTIIHLVHTPTQPRTQLGSWISWIFWIKIPNSNNIYNDGVNQILDIHLHIFRVCCRHPFSDTRTWWHGFSGCSFDDIYHLVMTNIAMENHHF